MLWGWNAHGHRFRLKFKPRARRRAQTVGPRLGLVLVTQPERNLGPRSLTFPIRIALPLKVWFELLASVSPLKCVKEDPVAGTLRILDVGQMTGLYCPLVPLSHALQSIIKAFEPGVLEA